MKFFFLVKSLNDCQYKCNCPFKTVLTKKIMQKKILRSHFNQHLSILRVLNQGSAIFHYLFYNLVSVNLLLLLLLFWIKQFNADSDLNSVALKAFMVLPTLILQKPSATSKSKEHSATIECRLALWKRGDLDLLLKEVWFIQG